MLLNILPVLLLPFTAVAQQALQLSLTFGNYYNDHAEHKFHASERCWDIHNGRLTYRIDAHEVRYTDSLDLRAAEADTLIKFIRDNDLLHSAEKDLKAEYKSVFDYREEIRGSIRLGGKECNYIITAHRSSGMDKLPIAKNLMALEQVLYRIVEEYRK